MKKKRVNDQGSRLAARAKRTAEALELVPELGKELVPD
jgi:hypothetical protein